MKIITLSKKQFEKLNYLNIPKNIVNTEGMLYNLSYKNKEKVFKKLYHEKGLILANKLYTIEMLNNYQELIPDNFCIPDHLVTVSHQIVGFTIPYIKGINLSTILNNKKIPLEEKIHYLKEIGKILDKLKTIRTYTKLNNFYINDLHEDNILVNTNNQKIFLIDLDSSKIESNQTFPSKYLTPTSLVRYVEEKYPKCNNNTNLGYIEATEESDLYCYNIMLLNFLKGENINNLSLDEYYDYLNILDRVGIHQELLDSFYKILNTSKNENPYPLLDSITYKQIYKTRKIKRKEAY